MFGKKLINIIILILILIIISIGIVSAEDNTTNIDSNDSLILLDNEKTFEDVQLIIDNASENDTIELEGIYNSNGGAIKINKSININSKSGATFDARHISNIFYINNASVCLKNLNFINSDGGFDSAICSEGNLTVTNCQFINNTIYSASRSNMDVDGAAIYSTRLLKIINSTFKNNMIKKDILIFEDDYNYVTTESVVTGGAIRSSGKLEIYESNFNFRDLIISFGDELNIINSNTSDIIAYSGNNTISNSILHGIDIFLEDANLTLNKCDIIECSYPVIFKSKVNEKLNTIIINQCNFTNNFIDYYRNDEQFDALINSDYSNIYVFNSTFKNNTMRIINAYFGKLNIYNSIFSNNTCNRLIGQISCDNITISNSTFTNNPSPFTSIYTKEIYLRNCNFTNSKQCAIYSSEFSSINGKEYIKSTTFNDSLNPIKIMPVEIAKFSTIYKSNEKISIIFNSPYQTIFDACDYMDIKLTNNKKIYYFDELHKGYFNPSNLPVGKYKIIFNVISRSDEQSYPLKMSTFKITKANTLVKAPKVTHKYKKSKYFKVSVTHKITKKAVKKTYVKIKIDKKTYKVKTDSKGIAKFNTKKLKIGKHKVVISSGNSNYNMSGKSTITIKK